MLPQLTRHVSLARRRTATWSCGVLMSLLITSVALAEAPDLTPLAQPGLAERVGLSDEQRATIAKILDERVAELVQAPADQRAQVLAKSNERLAAVLTAEQLELFKTHTRPGTLLFNFRQQKWPEVLEWFSGQADMSLVMDVPPPGNFTYSDTKEYTPTEAIDLLNSVLLSKGFTLIRRDRMLVVVEIAKGIPYDLVPQVDLEQLADRGRFELVSVLFALGNKPVEGVLTEIKGLLGAYGKATPLPQTKQLLVTETAGRMQAINVVIASVPEPAPPVAPAPAVPPPAPIFTPYSAIGLDLPATVKMLESMFEKAKFQSDANTQQIHAYAPPDQQASIKAAIEQMLAGVESDQGRRLEIIPLAHADLSKVQQQLALAVPNAQITADATEKRLLVMGNASERQQIREVLQQLTGGIPATGATSEVTVYEVPVEATAPLTTLLQQILPQTEIVSQPGRIAVRGSQAEQTLARSTLDQMKQADANQPRPSIRFYDLRQTWSAELLTALKQIVPQATISLANEGKQLSAVAMPRDHEQVEATIKQIEAGLPPQAPRTLKIYPVSEDQKQRFQTLLPDLKQELASVKWIPEASPREMAAFATDEQHAAIQLFLDKLAEVTSPDQPRTLHRFPILVREPPRLLTLLKEAFPTTHMLLNERQDALLVWERADHLADVQKKLDELIAQLPPREERTLEIYPTPYQRVEELQALLTPVVKDASINPDPLRKRLIVWGTAKDHQEIAAVLAKVADANAQSPAKQLVMYDVPEADAAAILTDVKSLIPSADIRLDAKNRRLIALGDEEEHNKIKHFVSQVLTKNRDTERVLIAYPLDHADPEAVLAMLKELRPDVQFAADTRSNRILATAPLREQPRLQAVIEQLDATPNDTSEQRLESYTLKLEDASIILPLLKPLLPKMELNVDVRTRQLVAKGSELDHQNLVRMLGRINDENIQDGSVRSYDTGAADAEQIRNVLRQLVPDAVIAADLVARRVLVWAKEADQTSVAEAMQQFSSQEPGAGRLLKTYPIPPTLGPTILTVLQSAVPGAAVSLDVQQRQVIGWGTEAQHAVLAAAVAGLQSPRENARLQLISAPPAVLQNARPLVLEFTPQAKIVNGADEGKWLVFATEEEQKSIAELIESLSRQIDPLASERTIKVYPLTARQAEAARTLIAQEVSTARILPSPDPRRFLIQATPEQHGRIEKILGDVRVAYPDSDNKVLRTHPIRKDLRDSVRTRIGSNLPTVELVVTASEDSVSAWASEEDHARIVALIGEFQEQLPMPIEREIRVYELRHATPDSVREILNSTLTNLTFVPTTNAQRLVVQTTPHQHERIAELIQEAEKAAESRDTVVQVYPAGDRITAQAILAALDTQLTRGAVIQANETSNSLVVRASAESQAKIKSAIESLVAQLPAGPTLAAEVHRFKNANPTTAMNVLQTLLPNARFAVDEKARTLAAAARPADQKLIQMIVAQMEASAPSANLKTKIYRMKRASAKTAQNTFSMLARDARVGFDSGSNAVIVTATEEDHLLIAEAAEQLDGGPEGSIVHVYPFEPEQVKADVVLKSLDDALRESVAIQVNEAANSLIVRGSEESHARVRTAIEAIVAQLPPARTLVTQVYQLTVGNPDVVRDALQPLLPQGRVSSDPASGSVIVSAYPKEQTRIAEVVRRLDVVPDRQPVVKAYPIRQAKGQNVFQSLQQALSGNRDFSLTYQADTNTVFVVATPRNQRLAEEILQTLDRNDPALQTRTAKAYPLRHIDGLAAVATVNSIFQNRQPNVNVQFDSQGNSIIVVATGPQHVEIEQTLGQLQGDERILEVFELQQMQPYAVEEAIRQLFGKMPPGIAPTVSGDTDSQRLFIRGTQSQIEQIQKLLEKLGETQPNKSGPMHAGPVRTIPFHGDTRDAVEQIERLWPELRQNRIEVIRPAAERGLAPPAVLQPLDPVQPAKPSNDETSHSNSWRHLATRPVFFSDPTPAAPEATGTALPNVVVVPDADRIVIASSDEQALDQLEALIRSLSERSGPKQGSNFAVFLLRNAGATDVVELLTDLFDRLPESRSGIGDAVFVADERLNALVVHGTPKERAVVKEILQVLDTEDLPDPLNSQRPELIPLKNTAAREILPLLQSIYKTQLSSGGGRRPMPIPEGVSSDVALILQQINAASSGPVLTLGADDISNSIVMRSPLELGREIIAFIEKLDQRAATPDRHVRIIPLEGADSDVMEKALQTFIRRSRRSQ